MDFISIGELLVDFLPGFEEGSYLRNAGGAPANVAISVARNNLESGMYCKVGDDDFGDFLLDTLRKNKVRPLSPEKTGAAITTMAFVTLNEEGDRSFTFARKPGADTLLDKSEIKDEDLKNCRLIQAGSCSLSSGSAAEATKYAMRRAHELKKLVSFDINYRDQMWNNNKEACVKSVLSILEYVDFLKFSEEEADMIGGMENVFAIMRKYNIAACVLTKGSGGAKLFYDDADYDICGYPAPEVADTTGAGDAFWGGFLSYLLNHKLSTTDQLDADSLKRAVQYGNVSGSLSVRTKGAISSLPTKEQIESFLSERGARI